jgi:AraC-like DNA-binding protein
MSNFFSAVECTFGKVVVMEVCHDLVQHAHSELEFGYWLSGGQCRSRVNDQPVVCSESQAVAINRYQAHDLLLNDATESVMRLELHVREAWLDEHFTHRGSPISFQNAQLIYTDEMKAICWQLAQKILFTKKNFQTIENDVVALLKATINGNITDTSPYPNVFRRKNLDNRLLLALSCIHDNMATPSLIKILPNLVGVSRSRLYELFKDELQSSPNLVWNCALLDSAMKQIVEKQQDLALISAQLGFSAAANFSRFFRENTGVTPTAYRKGIHTVLTKPTEPSTLE